ncbi:MAG TPA: DUF1801 domain-containing protein [Chryseolinea sp.]|nr:DUF1801 domain-containing protein [Chryseolinea sp.]
MKGPTPKDINDYLGRYGEDVQEALERLRVTIISACPKAQETISYQIPVLKYKGSLVGFGAAKHHCAFYVMSNTIIKDFAKELAAYDVSTGTVRFTVDKPLPVALIKKIVKARIKENETMEAVRAAKKRSK